MLEQAPRYPSYDPDVEPYQERPTGHPVAPYQPGQSQLTNYQERSLPLFLSDPDGEPVLGDYTSLSKRRGSYFTSRILAGVVGCAGVAVLVALVSSDVARDAFASAKASTSAAFSAASAAMQPNSTPPKGPDAPINGSAQLSPQNQALPPAAVAAVAVMPSREDIKTAYQSALQGSAQQPAAASVPERAVAEDTVHHLEPSEIATLLARANTLISSGDIAAARLVLRRAAEAEDARAAMTLAKTYDPAVLEKLGVRGVVPDMALAQSWYEKARRFGAPEPTSQPERLAIQQH
jgi:hypothetical protein